MARRAVSSKLDAETAGLVSTTCPHDCPSVCALDLERRSDGKIGRVYANRSQTYTNGVICAKVARYGERADHPERLLYPLIRKGDKGSGAFQRVSWDEALDLVASRFLAIESEHGAEAIWPYYYAGTMGRVMRDGINALTHVKRYSRFYESICVNMAWAGYRAGAGAIRGVDPREMADADCIVFWGTNAAATQINALSHAVRARRTRGTKIIAIDVYQTATLRQADLALCLKPGSDGALACAVMHALFRDGLADRAYLARYGDDPAGLEAHLQTRTPEWAAAITGLGVADIEAFARLVGTHKNSFFRLGYGFTRQRNGATNMHAALCVPVVSGAWQHRGGGAFHSNSGIFHLDQSLLEAHDARDDSIRALDQSRIGAVLCNDPDALKGGVPVRALLIQNTNPMSVAPDQTRVRQGFARNDLFTVVHEQFMTETAAMADVVLPATMFTEHDDIYCGGGHQHLSLGPKLVPPPGECRSNRDVIVALAARLGARHAAFEASAADMIEQVLRASGWGGRQAFGNDTFLDVQPEFDAAHFSAGFAWPDGKFRLKADWHAAAADADAPSTAFSAMPGFPDHWPVNERDDATYPFQLATSPAHNFLNSSFNKTPSSLKAEGEPMVLVHSLDAARLNIKDAMMVRLESPRGQVRLRARVVDRAQPGVLISEGIWPNHAFADGGGINTLTNAEPVAPLGGAAVHDCKVRLSLDADGAP